MCVRQCFLFWSLRMSRSSAPPSQRLRHRVGNAWGACVICHHSHLVIHSATVTSPRATGLTHLPSAMTGAARVRCLCPSSSEVAPLEPMCTEAALGTCVDTPPAGHPCSGLTSEDQKHASWSQGLPACLAACFVGSYLPPIPASCFPSAENLVCFAARRPPVLVVAGFLNRTQTH